MSIAIHITTHAPAAEVEKELDAIAKIAKRLEAASPEGKPATTWAVTGTDYSGPVEQGKPIAVEHRGTTREA